jgi:hypothetical protein
VAQDVTQRLNARLHRLFVVLFLAYAALIGFGPVMAHVDLGWHLAEGRWMVQHFAFYRHDAFDYPNLGHPVVNEYTLFQLLLYAAWSLGWWGPSLLTALAFLLLAAIFLRAEKTWGASPLHAIALGLMLVFLHVSVPLRPHLLSFLALATLGVFLLRHRDAMSWTVFWPMALLQIAWTNSHGAFVLGPALVGAFGAEVIIRRALVERKIPWPVVRTWFFVFLLILFACFANPEGAACFYPPFFQASLESIRAYVGEMQPLPGLLDLIFRWLGVVCAALVLLAALRRRALAWSFLAFALFFFFQALAVRKSWPVFGLFLPLLVLGSAAWGRPARTPGLAGVIGYFVVIVSLAIALFYRVDPRSPFSFAFAWREFDHGRTDISQDAVAWMKTHGITGRIFHRCEDGGWLQQEGFTETFADTGMGKYDPFFIREIGLVGERPEMLPLYLHAYRPDYVVCGTYCYLWPYHLRQEGWRLIFYSTNSSVWTRPETRPDLPTLTSAQVIAAFNDPGVPHGSPFDSLLDGRNLIALHSLGLDDFAFARLRAAAPDESWYWEAAGFMCFTNPCADEKYRQALLTEADHAPTPENAAFRAKALEREGRGDDALRVLQGVPPEQLNQDAAELLLKLEVERHLPGALALARRTDCFDLRNGRHWQYLAEAEESAGNIATAASAWKRAVFYYPDDDDLLAGAASFARSHADAALARDVADSRRVYGAP